MHDARLPRNSEGADILTRNDYFANGDLMYGHLFLHDFMYEQGFLNCRDLVNDRPSRIEASASHLCPRLDPGIAGKLERLVES